jgi:heat shock protein HtpX
MLRIALFLGTNLAVLALLAVVMAVLENVFGVRLDNNVQLLVMAAVLGFGGAFISLAMSKTIAKMTTGAQVITQPANPTEAWLVETVRRHAEKAGIGMPEVAIFPAPEMNAFATGMSRNSSLVAVSVGLLQHMDRREVEAVIGHEISHIANGDMVTMALLQGVLNTFVIVLARVLGSVIDNALRGGRGDGGRGPFYFVIVIVLQIGLGILASMIAAWFSRRREFRADAGGAALEGRDAMIAALNRLRAQHDATTLPEAVKAFGISGPIGKLLASHPPLEERIAALQSAR